MAIIFKTLHVVLMFRMPWYYPGFYIIKFALSTTLVHARNWKSSRSVASPSTGSWIRPMRTNRTFHKRIEASTTHGTWFNIFLIYFSTFCYNFAPPALLLFTQTSPAGIFRILFPKLIQYSLQRSLTFQLVKSSPNNNRFSLHSNTFFRSF